MRSWPLTLLAVLVILQGQATADDGLACCQAPSQPAFRIGAVASGPGTVTVFQGLRRHLARNGLDVDYVLYSNYDALVEALHQKQVDVAWNTPLAHAKYHRLAGNASQALVMRDVDRDFRSKLIVRKDASIAALSGLAGKTLILGSRDAAEATVLPLYYLGREGIDTSKIPVLSLDREMDLRGNPCSSEVHVLQALREGRGQAGIIGERLWNRLQAEHPEQVADLADLWTTPAFSHCVFTARLDFNDQLARRFTELMTAMDPADPLSAEVMRLEGTRQWCVGSQEGFRDLVRALDEPETCCCCEPETSR